MRRLPPAVFLWCAFLSVPLAAAILPCESCTKGKFCESTPYATCKSCPAGKFQSSAGQRDCVTCAEGKYQSEEGADACIYCSTGWYQNAEEQTTCKRCKAGQSAQTEGSSADDSRGQEERRCMRVVQSRHMPRTNLLSPMGQTPMLHMLQPEARRIVVPEGRTGSIASASKRQSTRGTVWEETRLGQEREWPERWWWCLGWLEWWRWR